MCGIAGLFGERQPDRLRRMTDRMAHRGPDDQGQAWIETPSGWLGLGSRRLAVLDPTMAGHQPMESQGALLSYNGEVYNWRGLRRQLAGAGVGLVSGTDTEVVLAVLNREGLSGLARIDGMFALAWWDPTSQELVLARDRFGIKPLYYSQHGRRLAFASEAKCLFAAGIVPELDASVLPSYLCCGWVPGVRTLFKGVYELPPGHVLRHGNGATRIETFREVVPAPLLGMDIESASRELRERLAAAVESQLVADVPVGVMFSGGLDSTAVAALAARSSRDPVKAYTIVDRAADAALSRSSQDGRFARLAAARLGLELAEIEVSPSIAALLEAVSWHLDDPVADPAALLTYIISQAAASQVTVLLSGQGSDEIFAGYEVHKYLRFSELAERQPGWAGRAESRVLAALQAGVSRLPTGSAGGLIPGALGVGRMMLDSLDQGPEERYLGYRCSRYFPDGGLGELLTPEIRELAAGADPFAAHREAWREHPEASVFDRMLYLDIRTFLLSQNLAYSDRMSMAASVELRVPFLDDGVADFAMQMPRSVKLRGLQGKAVLRRAMSGLVPQEVISRRKAGFSAPVGAWLRGELVPFVHDHLGGEWLEEAGIFEPSVVRRLISEHTSGQMDHTQRIWVLMAFVLWWRAHLQSA